MAERVWARDRLFNGFDRYKLEGGDRRIFEDVAMAPIGQNSDPLIGGVGDRRVVVDSAVDLNCPVDERDESYADPDESCEQLLHGLAPSEQGVNPWKVIKPERCSSPVPLPPAPNGGFVEGDKVCQEICGEDGHVGLCDDGPARAPFGSRPGEVGVQKLVVCIIDVGTEYVGGYSRNNCLN